MIVIFGPKLLSVNNDVICEIDDGGLAPLTPEQEEEIKVQVREALNHKQVLCKERGDTQGVSRYCESGNIVDG